MFQHYCVILRELVISILPSYTSISNAVVFVAVIAGAAAVVNVVVITVIVVEFPVLKFIYYAVFKNKLQYGKTEQQ